MTNVQYITCPDCGARIPFDPLELVRGVQFACPQCPDVSIGLHPGSRDKVKSTLDELTKLREDLGKPKRPPGA